MAPTDRIRECETTEMREFKRASVCISQLDNYIHVKCVITLIAVFQLAALQSQIETELLARSSEVKARYVTEINLSF